MHLNPLLPKEDNERMLRGHQEILDTIPLEDTSLYLKVSEGLTIEWWKCADHFRVKEGIVHIINQRQENKESWISFSTGRIMRPEISEF